MSYGTISLKYKKSNVRDLYELLLKKQALDDQLNQSHQVVRKSNRSPSLRLRFGKRRDPYATNAKLMGRPYQYFEEIDN
ncbi:hypothetical protein RUM43_000704 [Polyplax serrata]|uniref:Uncharacterized protein n=1 Tax=Polyplax serrata TaxID=468196 RepID=A0AAN8SGG5_POLSC